MKKKIGGVIVSGIEHTNYGSSLQAYATMKVVQHLGYDLTFIKYEKRRNIFDWLKIAPGLLLSGGLELISNRLRFRLNCLIHPTYLPNQTIRRQEARRFKEKEFVPFFKTYIGYKNLCEGSKEYDAIFPARAYEDATSKSYPIVLKAFDVTNEEMMQKFLLSTVSFVDFSFDYLIVLLCNDENHVFPMALKFSKRFFETMQEILISGDENIEVSYMMPYPINITPEIMKCFDKNIELQTQSENPYLRNIGDIGEELWVYSKIRELLSSNEDKTYCSFELKKVMDKICIMQKEVRDHLDIDVADQIIELCNAVYAGDRFDNEQFNEFIQIVQSL